jgi:hypothetical protein
VAEIAAAIISEDLAGQGSPRTPGVPAPGRAQPMPAPERTVRQPGRRTPGYATSWPGRPLSWPPTAAKSRPPCWTRRWPRSGRPPSRCG